MRFFPSMSSRNAPVAVNSHHAARVHVSIQPYDNIILCYYCLRVGLHFQYQDTRLPFAAADDLLQSLSGAAFCSCN